ncbi:hypothetical protein D3C77_759280 [compost metagenome]
MILHHRHGIFEVLLDSRPQLPRLADEQELILIVVEHKDARFIPRNLNEVRESVYMA